MTDQNRALEIMDDDAPAMPMMATPSVSPEMATQILLAHQFPRNERQAVDKARQMACENKDISESCFYSIPRGEKRIVGPSVRLAEIMATTWGNLHVMVRQGDDGDKYTTATAHVYDMQTLTSVSVEKRRRATYSRDVKGRNGAVKHKAGERYNDDMLTVTANAAASIAFRDAVFRIVPKNYVQEVYEAAREVALEGAKSMKERRQLAAKWWEDQGVDRKMLLDHLGYASIDEMTLDDLDYLTGLRTGLRQRDYDVSDIFSAPRTGEREKATVSPDDVTPAKEQPTESEKASAQTSPKPKAKAKAKPKPKPQESEGVLRDTLGQEIGTRNIPRAEWNAMCEELGVTNEYTEIPTDRLVDVIEATRNTFAKLNPPGE